MQESAFYEVQENYMTILRTCVELLQHRGSVEAVNLLTAADISIRSTDYDNWNGGTYSYTVFLSLPIKIYAPLDAETKSKIEQQIALTFNEIVNDECHYFCAKITPKLSDNDTSKQEYIGDENWRKTLISELDSVKNYLISVATGKDRIDDVNSLYKDVHHRVKCKLKWIGVEYLNKFNDLWEWYSYYNSNQLAHYSERRDYINELFSKIVSDVEDYALDIMPQIELSLAPWESIHQSILKIKNRAASANDSEDYQAIGVLCRELLISLAKIVYNPNIHGKTDETGTEIGATDSKRMLINYINTKVPGSSKEQIRRFIKCVNDLSNMLTHQRTATKRDLLLTINAVFCLVNSIRLLDDNSIGLD